MMKTNQSENTKRYLTNMKEKHPEKWQKRMHRQAFYNTKSYIKKQASWEELTILLKSLIRRIYMSDTSKDFVAARKLTDEIPKWIEEAKYDR